MTAAFYFDPDADQLGVFLGPIEAELMELVWQQGRLSVKQARYLLVARKDLAYTTIMTVLSRLADKGLLLREKDGRNFVYHPVMSRTEYIRERITKIRTTILQQFPDF